jgi:adenylosuccinate synthase
MNSIAVLGCMWGDEAKAKMVDYFAKDADIIVRFQGGNNAGHTIHFENRKFVFHLVPSGILYPEKICVLAAGVVIDPFAMREEMEILMKAGISFQGRFFIDPRAGVVLPIHKILDEKQEKQAADQKIGTTKRGIGPCYSDIASRIGIRFYDLANPESLRRKIEELHHFHGFETDVDELVNQLSDCHTFFQSYQMQVSYYLNNAYKNHKKIIFEGAQGALLDLFFGTYPYVTSSHTISGGISIGCGFSPSKIDSIVGVYKSYFTRVGSGPFPTELHDEVGEKIRIQGNEFGSTTGRPRRCGWFDCVAANYTAMVNGLDEISLTLLDVLSGFETIKICVSYQINGINTTEFPFSSEELDIVEPVYHEMEGWKEDISRIQSFADLPKAAQNYVTAIETYLNIPIKTISVGPERNQTIQRNSLL